MIRVSLLVSLLLLLGVIEPCLEITPKLAPKKSRP